MDGRRAPTWLELSAWALKQLDEDTLSHTRMSQIQERAERLSDLMADNSIVWAGKEPPPPMGLCYLNGFAAIRVQHKVAAADGKAAWRWDALGPADLVTLMAARNVKHHPFTPLLQAFITNAPAHVRALDLRAHPLVSKAVFTAKPKARVGKLVAIPAEVLSLGGGPRKVDRMAGFIRLCMLGTLKSELGDEACHVATGNMWVGQLIDLVFGEDYRKTLYRSAIARRQLVEALALLKSLDHEIQYWHEDGLAAAITPVYPTVRPLTGALKEPVAFHIKLPRGPAVTQRVLLDMDMLRAGFFKDRRCYSLVLHFFVHWSEFGLVRPGRYLVPSHKPEHYDKHPIDDDQLVAWAYPEYGPDTKPTTRRQWRARTKHSLAFLISEGYVIRTPKGGIMPGPKWAGWSDKQMPHIRRLMRRTTMS